MMVREKVKKKTWTIFQTGTSIVFNLIAWVKLRFYEHLPLAWVNLLKINGIIFTFELGMKIIILYIYLNLLVIFRLQSWLDLYI